MTKQLLTFTVLGFLSSCSNHNDKSRIAGNAKDSVVKKADTSSNNTGYYQINGDSLIIPPFDIAVDLSPKANQKLTKDKETIIVDASFSGQPKDTSSKYYLENGGIFVASAKRELVDSNRIAKFEGVKFSRKLFDSLADKDIELLINVYSGRRSARDNLLNCDIFEDKITKIMRRRFVIKGKLIYGDK